ncbi:hypothetical protein QTO05_10995, partial [Vibrio fortis]
YAECVVDGQVIERIDLTDEKQSLSVEAGYHWCRIDIRRGSSSQYGSTSSENGEFEGCINAVFDGTQPQFNQPLVDTWGELMERVNSDEV